MSVLRGEGTHPILYGSYPLPVGRNLPAYLARPDQGGAFPTIVLAHGARGLTPFVKSLCRRLARHGFSVMCPDLYRGSPLPESGAAAAAAFAVLPAGRPGRDLLEAAGAAEAPGTEWADGRRIVFVGLDAGGLPALAAAPAERAAAGVVVASTPLDEGEPTAADLVISCPVAVLGLYGAADEASPPQRVREVRSAAATAEFVVYGDVAGDFFDDGAPGYDHAAAEDAFARMAAFLERVTSGLAVDPA